MTPSATLGRQEESTMTETAAPIADNGVNVAHLLGARQALTDAPEAAQFPWCWTRIKIGESLQGPYRKRSLLPLASSS